MNEILNPFYIKREESKKEFFDFIYFYNRLKFDESIATYQNEGIYCEVSFAQQLPTQGWKVHVSCTLDNSFDILQKVSFYCFQNKVSYKFIQGKDALLMSFQKNSSRASSGKFITIYPKDKDDFVSIIQDLYKILKNFDGPYILSDKRYKDCKVLYYRYGRIRILLEEKYKDRFYLTSPEGEKVKDERNPYFTIPSFIKDPFPSEDSAQETLLNKKYDVLKALHTSNSGGVYLAKNIETEKIVVIKEARPHLIGNENKDYIYLRKKEKKSLEWLNSSNLTPNLLEDFYEWEHYFIAVEYIDGENLAQYAGKNGPLSVINKDKDEISKKILETSKLIGLLIKGVDEIHNKGIIIGDISAENVMFNDNGVYFVDLEYSIMPFENTESMAYSPGYYDFSLKKEDFDHRLKDIISLGYLIMKLFINSNFLSAIDRKASLSLFKKFSYDYNIPENIIYIVNQMICCPEELSLKKLGKMLDYNYYKKYIVETEINLITDRLKKELINRFEKEIIFESSKLNKYFPANLMHGDIGVILNIAEGTQEELINKYINEKVEPILNDSVVDDVSFYTGFSGLIYALCEINKPETALLFLNKAIRTNLFNSIRSPFLSDGYAGVGIALTKLYKSTATPTIKNIAIEIGESLLAARANDLYWEDENKKVSVGISNGNMGICYFLIELFDITKDYKYLRACEKTLNFFLSNTKNIEGGLLIRTLVYEGPMSPYLDNGIAGITKLTIKYLKRKPNETFSLLLNEMLTTCMVNFASNPSLMKGLSGLGLILVEAYEFTKEEKYLKAAYNTFETVKEFKVRYKGESFYPSHQINKVSSDLETGEAGILFFFNKLLIAME